MQISTISAPNLNKYYTNKKGGGGQLIHLDVI